MIMIRRQWWRKPGERMDNGMKFDQLPIGRLYGGKNEKDQNTDRFADLVTDIGWGFDIYWI